MAEFVEYRTEEMIPELEQLERIGLFDKPEIRQIIKNRKDYEYKIQRRTKCKEDFLRYIQYEMDLLKLIRLRREKMSISNKKGDIDYAIANRVNKLFKQAIFRFQNDVRLWVSYLKFSKQVRFNTCSSRMLTRMLQVHGDKPYMWSFAAKFEFEESMSVENARKILLRGLREHPESKMLYTEAFRLELMYANLKRSQQLKGDGEAALSRDGGSGTGTSSVTMMETQELSGAGAASRAGGEEGTDQVSNGKLAQVIFESAVKKIQDVAFTISLLAIAKEYDFTVELQRVIIDYLLTRFPHEELTWDAMARRELEGLCYSGGFSGSPKTPFKNTYRERIKVTCIVYQAAVKRVSTDRMWSFYLETLIELNQDLTHLPVYKKKLLRSALQAAHAAGHLQEKYYLMWVDMLQTSGKHKKLEGILRTATERLPDSVELWQCRLRFHIVRDEEALVHIVFRDATSHLDDSSALPLWRIMLHYYQARGSPQVERVLTEGMAQGPVIAMVFKPLYLEWLTLTKGITATRRVYESLSTQPPLCLEMHSKMAAIECMQPEVKLKLVRRCHETACEQFGKSNTDVWMEYIKFEIEIGDPMYVSDIYNRAKKMLDSLQTDSFVSEFNLLKTGMSAPKVTASK